MSKTTIAIPTIKGRETILLNCLATILSQTHKKWDLMICTTNPDTKCEDRDTKNPLNNFLHSISLLGHKVTIIYDKFCTGPGTAVQQLIEASENDLIWRVDDDVILTERVLEKLYETHCEYQENVGAVSAPVNGFGASLVDYQRYWASKAPHLIGNGNYHSMNDNFTHHSTLVKKAIAEVDFLSGYCLFFSKKTLLKIGGYISEDSPKHHREDWYAMLKLKSLGYRLLLRADCLAFHNHYKRDESDFYRASRSKEDHALFNKFKEGIDLPNERNIGIIEYET